MKKSVGSKISLLTGTGFLFAILSISYSCTKPMDNSYGMGTSAGSGTGAKGGSSGTAPNEVIIQGMAFSPSVITVIAGTRITWTNNDSFEHTVTSDTGLFDSGTISGSGAYGAGGSYSYTFITAGTFPYHCTTHPMMTATVIVI